MEFRPEPDIFSLKDKQCNICHATSNWEEYTPKLDMKTNHPTASTVNPKAMRDQIAKSLLKFAFSGSKKKKKNNFKEKLHTPHHQLKILHCFQKPIMNNHLKMPTRTISCHWKEETKDPNCNECERRIVMWFFTYFKYR